MAPGMPKKDAHATAKGLKNTERRHKFHCGAISVWLDDKRKGCGKLCSAKMLQNAGIEPRRRILAEIVYFSTFGERRPANATLCLGAGPVNSNRGAAFQHCEMYIVPKGAS